MHPGAQVDAPVVVDAFLKHDLAALQLHCGPELLERLTAIFKHFAEQVRFLHFWGTFWGSFGTLLWAL